MIKKYNEVIKIISMPSALVLHWVQGKAIMLKGKEMRDPEWKQS